ncbi:MAG: amidohydrolase [Bacillota bacterium]|nr:MAG: amidohydrolase [Bacillota bacterium]
MAAYDFLIKGARLVDPIDPQRWMQGPVDIAVKAGRVAAVKAGIPIASAADVYHCHGETVFPGIIDSHVHMGSPPNAVGHKMLALAGVTTAVDFAGPMEETVEGARQSGAGLNVAGLHRISTDLNMPTTDPKTHEIRGEAERALDLGAIGLKVVGGHLPLTPEATARVREVANDLSCYFAFHVGTTATGSNIEGLREAVEIIGDGRAHIAHINAYCRGQKMSISEEVAQAVDILTHEAPHLVSEAYMGTVNGTFGACIDGVPKSAVTRTCLRMAGYPETEEGLVQAIRDGYCSANVPQGGQVVLKTGEEGVEGWRAAGAGAFVSFAVNSPEAAFLLATARRAGGDEFVVDAMSTDGGSIPRNVQLERGLALVQLGALSLSDLARKFSYNPALMFGFEGKGRVAEGFDADLTMADLETRRPVMTMVGGRVVMYRGLAVGSGATFLTTGRGAPALEKAGFATRVVDVTRGLIYTRGA